MKNILKGLYLKMLMLLIAFLLPMCEQLVMKLKKMRPSPTSPARLFRKTVFLFFFGMLLLGKSKGCDLYACSREPLFQNELSYNVQVNAERAILHCNVSVLILLLRGKRAAHINLLRILMFGNSIIAARVFPNCIYF